MSRYAYFHQQVLREINTMKKQLSSIEKELSYIKKKMKESNKSKRRAHEQTSIDSFNYRSRFANPTKALW